MKTIFLFSSIFYLLGLKIGHKIDLFKNSTPVEKITVQPNVIRQTDKTVHFSDELKLKTSTDSILNPGTISKTPENKKHF